MNSKTLSATFASLVLMSLLTSCYSAKQQWPAYAVGQQPDYLYLTAGTVVQTPSGLYQVRQNEKWVNPKVLERKDEIIQLLLDGAKAETIQALLQD